MSLCCVCGERMVEKPRERDRSARSVTGVSEAERAQGFHDKCAALRDAVIRRAEEAAEHADRLSPAQRWHRAATRPRED